MSNIQFNQTLPLSQVSKSKTSRKKNALASWYIPNSRTNNIYYIDFRIIKQLTQFYLPPAHPKARLFITHGGLGGIQEAIFNAVPMLGLPIINDQFFNMAKVAKEGAGLTLEWDDINDEYLKTALDTILNDPR